jgi:hypothetical protein
MWFTLVAQLHTTQLCTFKLSMKAYVLLSLMLQLLIIAETLARAFRIANSTSLQLRTPVSKLLPDIDVHNHK